jgi:hypothetical protein
MSTYVTIKEHSIPTDHPLVKNSKIIRMRISTYLFLLLLMGSFSLSAQVSAVEFGKNRVQHHDDFEEWSQYESRNFITYWYGEARMVGQAVVLLAEQDFARIESTLEHRMNDKIEIIVYTDITDLKQSNIGTEEAFVNVGGQTKIVGNKMFVYYDGNHNNLRRQIREGVASVYLNAMLFGSNLQEIVQNAVMMNLPEWFKQGMISFVGEEWNTELDNELRDIFLNETYEDFEEFAEENPTLAGHSLWYFISQNFGKATVSNLLYLTRINRSIESGFLYVLGSSFEKTTESWESYFYQRYKGETRNKNAPNVEPLPIKNKRNLPITQVKLSPNGKNIAYVTNEIGRFKVAIYDIATGERKQILKEGFRNAFQATDYNYPLLAWTPSGMELAIIYEKRDVIKLLRYDVNAKEKILDDMAPQFQRIFSMDYIDNFNMVLTGAIRGNSDVFLYFTKTRQAQRVTFDFWDDLDARYVEVDNQRGILFASNRVDSIMQTERLDSIVPTNKFDIFYYDLENRSDELVRVTNTPYANERQPVAIDTTYFSFLSDDSGINNRFAGYLEEYIHHYDKIVILEDGVEITMHPDSALTTELDSAAIATIDTIEIVPILKKRAITYPISNLDRSILRQHTAPATDKIVSLQYRDGTDQIYVNDLNGFENPAQIETTLFKRKQQQYRTRFEREKQKQPEPTPNPVLKEKENKPIEPEELPKEKETEEEKVDIDNYLFQTEFNEEEVPPTVEVEEDSGEITLQKNQPPQPVILDPMAPSTELEKFRPARITPYRLKFRTDFVTTQLDNNPLFEGLNSFSGTPNDFLLPPPGILIKGNFKDLFEDYQLEGGVRIPTSFNGAEYFLLLDDKKKRLDKRYAAYRRSLRFPGEGTISSPIQPKTESNTFLTQMQVRYPLDIFTSIRVTGTLRFDNLIYLATDVNTLTQPSVREQRVGLRAEYVFDNTLDVALNIKNGARYKFYAEMVKRFNIEVVDRFSLDLNEGFMTVIGLDARFYQRVLKHSVFAVRAAGATSFGSEKILYSLGGVDNWLFPRQNDEIPLPDAANFAFQAPAPNIRGFSYNIRNGNSFALINSELRMPIFKYFSKNLRSNFLRNFQVVGFFDIGTAWQGLTPFTDENPLNTKIIPDPPIPSNPVTVKVRFFRDPIVMGYGAGIRTLLFGYFLRVDYGWGIETREIQQPRLYIALGTDF